MANLERTSWTSLFVIPRDKMLLMHRMYEDNDLVGANNAEEVVDFLNAQTPGLYTGILANDSVTPPCCNQDFHFECDFYAPHWYTVLVATSVWNEYQDAIKAKDQEHKAAHGCKQEPKTYPDLKSAQEAMDRGETVRIEVQPFQVDPQLVQMAIDLQQKERFEEWKSGNNS